MNAYIIEGTDTTSISTSMVELAEKQKSERVRASEWATKRERETKMEEEITEKSKRDGEKERHREKARGCWFR